MQSVFQGLSFFEQWNKTTMRLHSRITHQTSITKYQVSPRCESFTAAGNAEGLQGRLEQKHSFKVGRSESCQQAQHLFHCGQGGKSVQAPEVTLHHWDDAR
jgi:hypothetical protein